MRKTWKDWSGGLGNPGRMTFQGVNPFLRISYSATCLTSLLSLFASLSSFPYFLSLTKGLKPENFTCSGFPGPIFQVSLSHLFDVTFLLSSSESIMACPTHTTRKTLCLFAFDIIQHFEVYSVNVWCQSATLSLYHFQMSIATSCI